MSRQNSSAQKKTSAKKGPTASKESQSQKSSAIPSRFLSLVSPSSAPSTSKNKRKAADLDPSNAPARLVVPADQLAAFQMFLKQQNSKVQNKAGQRASEKAKKAAEDKSRMFLYC